MTNLLPISPVMMHLNPSKEIIMQDSETMNIQIATSPMLKWKESLKQQQEDYNIETDRP